MLGSLIHNKPWCWTAVGKHPAASDYINLDGGSPLLDALADWMAKGYDEINRGQRPGAGPYSWRFWLRGAKKGVMICGVVRDSSDRIGRPFPLLIMGEGSLKNWEKQWERLPGSLIKTWQRMESMAAQRFEDLNAMTEALRHLNSPDGPEPTDPNETLSGELQADVDACKLQLQQDGRAMVALRTPQDVDALYTASQWHLLLKSCFADIPRAVFWGGTPAQTYMAIFANALNTHDFVKLWTV